MNILLLGSGGREHALAWKIAASPLTDRLFCAPGNAGIAQEAECVALDLADHGAVIAFCRANQVDFVVVGPEGPLVAGIVDDLEAAGIKAFGPTRAAARLEGSKGFTKDLCRANGIPTAAYERFTAPDAAKAYVRARGAPIVVKADGLAAGKGVVVATTVAEAEAAIDMIASQAELGTQLVVEEFLAGEEASFFVLSDGEHALPLASAQDHKRVLDGDRGPNTGGMGAYSPRPRDDAADERARPQRDRPSHHRGHEEARRALPRRALCRADDHRPGAQADRIQCALRRSRNPGADAAPDVGPGAGAGGGARRHAQELRPALVCGRRAHRRDGRQGLSRRLSQRHADRRLAEAATLEGVEIFHAGTAADGDRVVATGGRVLNVSALGASVGAAQARAYTAIDRIRWPEGFCRRDIGWQAVAREKASTGG